MAETGTAGKLWERVLEELWEGRREVEWGMLGVMSDEFEGVIETGS